MRGGAGHGGEDGQGWFRASLTLEPADAWSALGVDQAPPRRCAAGCLPISTSTGMGLAVVEDKDDFLLTRLQKASNDAASREMAGGGGAPPPH